MGVQTSMIFRAGVPDPRLADRVDMTLIIALVASFVAARISTQPHRITTAAHLVLGAAMTVIVACLSVIGGIEAPLTHWVGVVPMLAVLLCGRRGAIAWACVAVVTVMGLAGADAVGWDLGEAGSFEGRDRSALWLYKLLDTISWSGMFLAVGLLYEQIRTTQTDALAAKNHALEQEIRQRTLAEEETRRLAYFDGLTGLPNRRSFHGQPRRER